MIYCVDISDDNEPPEFIATTNPGGYEVVHAIDSWKDLKGLYLASRVDSLLGHDVPDYVELYRHQESRALNSGVFECRVDDWFKMVFKEDNKGG